MIAWKPPQFFAHFEGGKFFSSEFWIDTWRKSPAEIHIETSITTNFLFQLAPDFQKNVFDKTHQNQAGKLPRVVQGDPGFFGVSVWYHRCSKDDDQQQFGASIGCLCLCLRGWNDFLPIRQLFFSISSILKTPLLFFSIWECVFFVWISPLIQKNPEIVFSTAYKNITKIRNASFCIGRCSWQHPTFTFA